MHLFSNDTTENLLPFDGVVTYHFPFLTSTESQLFFEQLLGNIPWQQDEVIMFGKKIITSRKMAWYADAGIPYTYSHSTKQALPWPATLLALKQKVEEQAGCMFNACLLNLYHDGKEGMGWHSDNEKSIIPSSTIASVSLGAARKFTLRHKVSKETIEVLLENGSLLLMKENTQQHWNHRLPPTTKVKFPRINLTFRQMVV